jgi:hypothetical protein
VAEKQKALIAPNFDFSLYRNLDGKNSMKIGIGSSAYEFREAGWASTGSGQYDYDRTREFRYLTFSAGYRHTFTVGGRVSPFVQTELLVERYRGEGYFLKEGGVAVKPQIGGVFRASDKLEVVFDAFYKSGIVAYDLNKDYIPFGYGIEIGVNMKI